MIVIATFEAKPGKEQELEKALMALIPQAQTEKYTLTYILHKAEQSPGKFTFYERFSDSESFDLHLSQNYLTERLEYITPLLSKTPVVEKYVELGAVTREPIRK